jgi:hypothetical protein
MLSRIEPANNIIIEMIPRYFSTWLNAMSVKSEDEHIKNDKPM